MNEMFQGIISFYFDNFISESSGISYKEENIDVLFNKTHQKLISMYRIKMRQIEASLLQYVTKIVLKTIKQQIKETFFVVLINNIATQF